MKPAFIPKTLGGKLNWLDEECSELGQAIAKTQRFREEKGVTLTQALHFFDPTVPDNLRETNHAWILRELSDLKQAIALFEATPIPCCEGDPNCCYKPHETFTCYRCKRLRCYCMGADGHIDCTDCWAKRQKPSKKKPHAKKQTKKAKAKSNAPRKARAKTPSERRARRLLTVRKHEFIGH